VHIIKSVAVLSVAKIMGAIYALIALIFVPFFLLAGLMSSVASGHNNPLGALGGIGIALLSLLVPVFYGGIGFIGGAVGALLYNLMAKSLGGIQIELQPTTYVTNSPIG
jgi:hypothetical protein